MEFFEVDPGAILEVASQKVVFLSLGEAVLCSDGRQVEVAVIESGILPVDEFHFLVVKEDIPGVEVMVGEDKLLGLSVELPECMKCFGVFWFEVLFESVGSASELDLMEFAQGSGESPELPRCEPALVLSF